MKNKKFDILRSYLSAYFSISWECFFINLYMDVFGKKRIDFLGQSWKDTFNKRSVNRWVNDNRLHNKINGIAVKTGLCSNLFLIDLDKRSEKNGVEYFKKLKVVIPPDTVSAETASGGLHYYFTFPEALKEFSTGSNLFNKISGIDTRGNGGLIITPPSKVAGGGAYKWLVSPFRGELRYPPQKLIDLILNYYENKNIDRQTAVNCQPDKKEYSPGEQSQSQKNILFNCLNNCAIASAGQRSERDFAFISWGVKINMPKDELWSLCQGVGKFKQKGKQYFERTFNNALVN